MSAFANCGRAVALVRGSYVPKAEVAALIRSPAPDVSDELISYYHERKTGEQVRSLRGSQPTIPLSPVLPSYFAGRAGVAVAFGSTFPERLYRHWRPLPAQRVAVVSEYSVQEAGQHNEGRSGIGAAQTTRPSKESCAFR